MALKSHKAWDLDLRSVWLLDNQSTFDLCCNPDFAQKNHVAKRAMNMLSNGGDMRISKECKVLGYDFWVWYSSKICFTTVTHLIVNRKVNGVWAAMHQIYQMYMLRGLHIVEIAGDGEFVWIADQVASLPANPTLDLAAANEHVGLIERNIRFLKEKVRSLRHSLPFEWIPALMLIRMVLHTIPFLNSFPQKGGLQHNITLQVPL